MKEYQDMENNIIETNNPSKKIELIKDSYFDIVLFFWNHICDTAPMGEKAREWFNAYHDAVTDIERRFQNNDFKSEEDRQFVDDELEQLYYMISDIDPSSPVLPHLHLVIEMIENGWDDIRMPR